MKKNNLKCGFVSIVGLTNVGKSTLINTILGSKVSIASHKVQTTRQRVLGIHLIDNTQIIFIDTPGYFHPKRKLDRAMISAAMAAPKDADITAIVVDPLDFSFEYHKQFIEKVLSNCSKKVILVINKIDLLPKQELLQKIEQFSEVHKFEKVFLVSATKGDHLESIVEYLKDILPLGPWVYPEDQISDVPSRTLASEITREKIYQYLHQEIPYAISVETEKWVEGDNSIKISQVINVINHNQKVITIGKQGSKLKQIGTSARKELAKIFNLNIHLNLYVRVNKKWLEDPDTYHAMGLDFGV